MSQQSEDNRQPVATSAVQKKGWRTTVAGACAGASEVLATMPLDVIKTNMQIHPKCVVASSVDAVGGLCFLWRELVALIAACLVWFLRVLFDRKYKNPMHAGAMIYREGGFRALYYGMPAFLIQTAGKGTVRFTAYEQFKGIATGVLGVDGTKYALAVDGMSGFLAGMTEAAIWTTPAERLKILRQVHLFS